MRKILFLNDYPMQKAWSLCDAGDYPSHHLWGMREISDFGYEVTIFPDQTWFGSPKTAKFITQQIQTLLQSGRFDIIFSACQPNTWLLARLKNLGLLRTRLVSLVHHPLGGRLQNQAYIDGHDLLVFLSNEVKDQVNRQFNVTKTPLVSLNWGPDLGFVQSSSTDVNNFDVISAGKANRDFATLIAAANGTHWRTEIYCANDNLANVNAIPENVRVHSTDSGQVLSYRQLYSVFSRSRIIAIPLCDVDALAGLTSLLDAIALGKPVVMTTNRWLGIDPESLGIGFSVAPGDVKGWNTAINKILGDSKVEENFSQNAITLRERLNIRAFSAQLAESLDTLFNE